MHLLKDDDILRWFRFSITESAPATYTETTVATNLNIGTGENNTVALIHIFEAELFGSLIEFPAAGANESINLQVVREQQTGILNLNSADLILKATIQMDRSAAIGTDAGPGYIYYTGPKQWFYNPPIIYGLSEITVGLLGTHASARVMRGRLGYTLATVPDKLLLKVVGGLIN